MGNLTAVVAQAIAAYQKKEEKSESGSSVALHMLLRAAVEDYTETHRFVDDERFGEEEGGEEGEAGEGLGVEVGKGDLVAAEIGKAMEDEDGECGIDGLRGERESEGKRDDVVKLGYGDVVVPLRGTSIGKSDSQSQILLPRTKLRTEVLPTPVGTPPREPGSMHVLPVSVDSVITSKSTTKPTSTVSQRTRRVKDIPNVDVAPLKTSTEATPSSPSPWHPLKTT
ncbi:hypothetical protein BC829DRAFT_119317 [Chytridium lagenaria]|nr:hypothetical protein BC829DRAFT_119317 [Chytridium lagenaria]